MSPDPLPWLLEPVDPAVRYWALRDLLGRPADDPELCEARAQVLNLPLVQEVFARQAPGGHWGEEAKPYTAAGTLGTLSLLYTLGVPADERTARACESLLRHGQHESGGLSLVGRRASGIFPCTTGEHLPMLVYFGFGDDPRVQRALAFVVESLSRPEPLVCSRYEHRPCLWGAIAALNGLRALPEAMRPAGAPAAVRRLADVLLDAPYDFAGEHKRWLTFGVPRVWDLMSALRALAAHGYGCDPRFAPLWERVLACRDGEGRWICGSVSRTFPLERRGKPSKWVTLDGLRLMREAGGA